MSTFTSFARAAKLAAAPLALGALAACATPFNANVSRFASALPAPQGQTFTIVADDPQLANGLEFRQYASFVADHLASLGYRPVNSTGQADLLVRFDYGVDGGRERVESTGLGYRDPFYSGWYNYRPFGPYAGAGLRGGYFPGRSWGYGWYDPFFDGGFGGLGGSSDVYSYTVYTSGVSMKIEDAHNGRRLFEGKSEAASTSNRLQYLVPNLVEALFTGFPGNSGETTRISVAPERQPVRRTVR
ncbi:MAG: DUF4136 domain-containing protein [Croceibacterium sp.]